MNKNWIEWIDLVRVIAILSVLLCHCSQGIYKCFDVSLMHSLSLFSNVFAFVLFTFGRLGVPLFLMITGYLLLNRTYDNDKTRNFWSKNCKHLIICTIIWIIIYEIFLITVLHTNVDWISFIANVLFFKKSMVNHIWYMPLIIGIYILIPFVSTALRHFDSDVIIKPVVFFSIIAFLCPFLTFILGLNGFEDLSVQISLGFSGGIFCIYVVFGYLMRKNYFKKIKSHWLALIFAISFVILVLMQLYLIKIEVAFDLWYNSPFILICSISLFELLSRIEKVRHYGVIRFLSKYAFAVFLIHNLFRMPLIPYVSALPISNPLKVISIFIVITILSYLSAYLIAKIPKIGKYILYIKG